jgi:signal transduction histidine kinase
MVRALTDDRLRNRRASAKEVSPRNSKSPALASTDKERLPILCVIGSDGCLVRDNRAIESWEMGAAEGAGPIEGLPHQACPHTDCEVKPFTRSAFSEIRQGRPARARIDVPCLKHELEFRIAPLDLKQANDSGVALVTVEDLTHRRSTEKRLRAAAESLSNELQKRNAQLERLNAALKSEVERHQSTEAALRRSESELHILSAQMFRAQETERKRIASELHDGIGASLGVIRQGLDNALLASRRQDCASVESALEALTPQIKRTVNDLRRVAMDLRPSTLDDIGVLATLSWFTREFAEAHAGISVEKRFDINERDVPANLKTAIFRISQEAFNNISKHARAARIDLVLSHDGDKIQLKVQDNGVGFDPDRSSARTDRGGGMGLGSMRERIEMSGGIFRIHSAPGRGTRLVATWQIAPAKQGH